MRRTRPPSAPPTGTSSGHHHDPRCEEPAERAERGPGSDVHAVHAVGGEPPADAGEHEQTGDESQPRARGGECRRQPAGARLPRVEDCRIHADQENSGDDRPVLPSYWMPKALMLDRRASAIVRSDPTGWNMFWNRTGWPSSAPKGTMSSTSKSIASP